MKKMIVWDLGATKCAAALVEYDPISHVLHCKKQGMVKLASCDSLDSLAQALESALDYEMRSADAIVIGAAGQFDGQSLYHEHAYPYSMDFFSLANQRQWPTFSVIHDYDPIICATFTSYMQEPGHIKYLTHAPMNFLGRRVALGLGTGLGLKDGVLLSNGDFWLGRNEIGHIGIPIPPICDPHLQQRHEELIRFLRYDNKPISLESILTGPGTVNLYRFLYPTNKINTPEELGEKIRQGHAPDVLPMLAWYLGLFIGSVQLIFMPEGGIWITGGVALHHLDLFDLPDFFQGIDASPAYLTQRKNFPLGVMCHPEHAFMGGAYYAVKKMLPSNISKTVPSSNLPL